MQQTFTYQSQPIFYSETGKGKTVVLLHGFGEDSRIWDNQVEVLSPHYHLIIPDLPGSGLSQIHNDNWDLISCIENMADCIRALVQHLTSEPVIIIGHSMGGYVLLKLAENAFVHKEEDALKIRAIAMVHSTAYADTEEKKENRRKAITHIEKHGANAFLKTAIPGLFAETFSATHPEVIEDLIEKGKSFHPKALIAYYEAMIARPDRSLALEKSEAPVLFIIGTEDKAAPMDDVLQQATLPEYAYVHILDTGHMSMLEDPGNLNKHLLSFIKDA